MTVRLALHIRRTAGWQVYTVEVPEQSYLLDALEAARRQDPSLLFRHACHHASCGTCGVRVNGRERLACLVPSAELAARRRPVTVEPLRNFPQVGDLAVDLSPLYRSIEAVRLYPVRRVEPELAGEPGDQRFENCIECGLCVSACPIAGTDPAYLGPAALAAAWRVVCEPRGVDAHHPSQLANQDEGLWRCHSVHRCTEVCPSNVEPGRAIMLMRRRVLLER